MSTLSESVKVSLHKYFYQLEGEPSRGIYDLVLSQVEGPMIEIVMQKVRGNQSKAALWLGISRGTLRKLLSKYNLC
jgi:DNA-binding protein Fis